MIASFATPAVVQLNSDPPPSPVRLVFIHPSVGWSWLNPEEGSLLSALRDTNSHISDTDDDRGRYDREVNDGVNIGMHTDIGHRYNWFADPPKYTYRAALYAYSMLSADLRDSETMADPGSENRIEKIWPEVPAGKEAVDSAMRGSAAGDVNGAEKRILTTAVEFPTFGGAK